MYRETMVHGELVAREIRVLLDTVCMMPVEFPKIKIKRD